MARRLSKKSLANLRAMHQQAKINSVLNTDEQALLVAPLYPEWADFKDGATLEAGQRVNHNDILYNVVQTHQKQANWTPDVAVSLFAPVLTSDTGEILEWVQPESTNGHMTGDRVTHNGRTWESLVDNNVWEPGAAGTESQWKEVTE